MTHTTQHRTFGRPARPATAAAVGIILFGILVAGGCSTGDKKDTDFFTSGSREADQRAEQQVAKVEQLRGGEEGAGGGEGDKKGEVGKKSLYDRIGGEQGVAAIIDDFVTRALADPRVNWERKGVRTGGVMGIRDRSVEWQATPENVEQLKKHLRQFVALATGGPTFYDGKEMKNAHAELRITNAEFDASVGDFKASLDKLRVPTDEQKELLSIVESTRPQIVGER